MQTTADIMNNKKGRCRVKDKKKNAFIFTTDSFLVLPLIIIAVSSFISFTVTLRENTIQHEYAYMISRDALNYISEVTVAGTGGTGNVSVIDSVAFNAIAGDFDTANATAALALDTYMPPPSGYILEYYDAVSGEWIKIREAGNQVKLSNPKIQVSNVKVVTVLSEPTILSRSNCASEVMCALPSSVYTSGIIRGPMTIRIRVFT